MLEPVPGSISGVVQWIPHSLGHSICSNYQSYRVPEDRTVLIPGLERAPVKQTLRLCALYWASPDFQWDGNG